MTEYISREAVNAAIINCMMADDDKLLILKRLSRIPAVDVKPVIHGEWKPEAGGFGQCSVCGSHIGNRHTANFCPNCGAKMVVNNETD